MSVKKAWELLSSKRESTLTVVNDNGGLEGLMTIGDIAKSIIEKLCTHNYTQYKAPPNKREYRFIGFLLIRDTINLGMG